MTRDPKEASYLLDLERDLVTTPEDIQALRKQHEPKFHDDWLERLEALAKVDLWGTPPRPRRTFAGVAPFEL